MFEFFSNNYRWSYTTLLAFAAGGQLGDIGLILPKLQAHVGEDAVWHEQWTWLGEVLERRASASSSSRSGSDFYYLASLYHTMGEHFVHPADPRRLESYRRVLHCFTKACELAPFSIERVVVPYEDTTLPAYFLSAGAGSQSRPAVIFVCGLDTTKELWFLRARGQFTARGISCLFIDTPGIGEALRLQKLYTRHDYEHPVGAAVDYLAARPDVDRDRIGVIGSSLGGYYVARAAAFEPRLRATIAWGAIYDYHRVWLRRLSFGGAIAAPTFQLMFITGADTIEQAVERISNFKVAAFADRIRCPFLIVHGADDRQVSVEDAHRMLDVVGSADKHLKIFSGEDGGAAHTQFDNHLPAIHYVADWMASKLQ